MSAASTRLELVSTVAILTTASSGGGGGGGACREVDLDLDACPVQVAHDLKHNSSSATHCVSTPQVRDRETYLTDLRPCQLYSFSLVMRGRREVVVWSEER